MENIKEIVTIIFSSTLVASIISAMVSIGTNRKSNSLKYVTEQRGVWREKIKVIAGKIEKTKSYKDKKVLRELKENINPYGEFDNNIFHDAHIWEVILEIEKLTNNNDFFLLKEKLLTYLSLLIKYDWERTKKEVMGHTKLITLIISIILGTLYLIYNHFIVCELEYNENFLLAFLFVILLPVILGQGECKNLIKEIWKKQRSDIIRVIFVRLFLCIGLVFLTGELIFLLFIVLSGYNFRLVRLPEGDAYLNFNILILVVFSIFSMTKVYVSNNINKKYLDMIDLCKKKFSETNEECEKGKKQCKGVLNSIVKFFLKRK